MFSLLKSKSVRAWCFFDFGISSYPTLILTFFYGAYYAKEIAENSIVGTSLWGFALSIASIITFLFLSLTLLSGRYLTKKIKTNFFKFFFYLMILFTFGLILFDKNSNQIIPLLFIIISFISFEIVNLFYNVSLYRVSKKDRGALSNLGWASGYLGGLISLLIIFLLLELTRPHGYIILNFSVFLIIGPFVALWTIIFGLFHFRNFKSKSFDRPDIVQLIKNFRSQGLVTFLISYFFFNNAVISIFAFASMFAAFLFKLSESEILFLGIFINLSGIIGCLIFGKYEDKIGSLETVKICIFGLLCLTLILFFTENITFFWLIALSIGFFIGPIQASSRSVLAKKIKSKNQLSAFSVYSMFGSLCSILGPFLVGLTIDLSESIRSGILIIPLFFILSLIPFIKINLKLNA
ncbi:MAG: hypothetical protein CBB92_02715 [Flammeovirgaceae bacterium TMED32]|nr:MAG: hypothetical protein CBB92_02715 [Flammeovirgaceae bacterium TMED32]